MEEVRAVVLDTPHAIAYYQIAALKGAVKMEKLGMRHSSGKSARKHACKEVLKTKLLSYDSTIEALDKLLEGMRSELQTSQ